MNANPDSERGQVAQLSPTHAGERPLKFTYTSGDRPLAGYTVKRGIGCGGFGEVYYAVSDGGKEVALKLVQRHLDVEIRGVSQCLNLKHPNLVILYDVKETDAGERWVVMEYMSGESLAELMERNRVGLAGEDVLKLLRGIADGVGYLHEHGIVHRDMKPGNIFIENGVVKIGDYGLAKFISASRRSGQTESVGTVQYMAPELSRGRYGKEIDLYAIGVMIYEMLTGRVPFEGQSPGEILMKHLTAEPDVGAVPEPFRTVVAHLLAKEPEQRLPSAQAILEHLNGSSAQVSGDYGRAMPPVLPLAPPDARAQGHAWPNPRPVRLTAPPPTVGFGTAQPTLRAKLDLGRCFNDAFAVYSKNWLILGVAAFLQLLLTLLSLSILWGPLSGGVCLMTLRAMRREDKSVQLQDMFQAFDCFGRLLGIFLLTIIPWLLGYALCVVPGLLLSAIWLFPYYFAVDKDLGVIRSLGASVKTVNRKGFGLNLLLVLVSFGISLIPSLLPYLGIIASFFVTPITWLLETSAYIQQVQEDDGELSDVLAVARLV
jgi:hypothetical protein